MKVINKNGSRRYAGMYLYTAAAALLLLLTALIVGCGTSVLTAPAGLTAVEPDADNPNRIEINWLPVTGADIYYVYRDTAPGGSFNTYAGFSVTSYTDDGGTLRYAFIENFAEGEGGTYYYRVTAASDMDVSASESALSDAVAASTYKGTWSKAADSVVFDSVKYLRLIASGTTELYAISSPAGAGAAISAKVYAEEETPEGEDPPEDPDWIWTALEGSPGNVSGDTADNPFSVLMSGGELYTVFADADADPADAVSMQYYHDSGTAEAPSFAWTAVGAAGFNAAAADGLTAALSGAFGGDIYSAFLETSDQISFYKFNDTTDTWFPIDISASLTADAAFVSLLTHSNTLYMAYEDTDGVGDGLYLRAYDDDVTALQAGGLVTASSIDDGNAVFVSGGGDLYAVYLTAADSLEVKKLDGSSWEDLDDVSGDEPPASTAAASDPGTLAAEWFNGYLYVFYVDSSDSRGWVKYYSEDYGWQTAERNQSVAVTGTTVLRDFQLASTGTKLYAGYIEGSKVYVRVLE